MKRLVFDADRIGPWVCEKAGGYYAPGDSAIGLEVDGELKVGVMYDNYTGASITMYSRCDDPAAPNRAFAHIFEYPFLQLGVKRIIGFVAEDNLRSRQLDEKLGFKQVATIPDYFATGDAIVYSMTKEDCRWLGRKVTDALHT